MLIVAAVLLSEWAQEELPKAPGGFRVERLLDVPPEQGSLRRLGLRQHPPQVETLDVPVGDAQALPWAYDSLDVNAKGPSGCGFYRAPDREVRLLRAWPIEMTEHGPHGIVPGPDGKLSVVVGNYTDRSPTSRRALRIETRRISCCRVSGMRRGTRSGCSRREASSSPPTRTAASGSSPAAG